MTAAVFLLSALALVQGGRPAATIVLPDSASDPERLAASQLRYWAREITGAELPVLNASAAKSSAQGRILIGATLARGAFDADLKALAGTEGFAIRRKGRDVFLFGARGCGTVYSVYELLESNTDIIWPAYREGVDRVFTPTNEIVLSACDTRQVPSVARRSVGHVMTTRAHYFYVRNRVMGEEGDFPYVRFGLEEEDWGCHTFSNYMTEEKFGKTHPEYFCLIDGNRVPPGWHANLCFTAPGSAEAFARAFIDNRIRNRKPLPVYGIGIEDTGATCQCADCLKPISLGDGKLLRRQDDPELFDGTRYFLWLNRVTAAIGRECPGVKIAAIAYLFTLRPPPIELHPNIVISYAPSSKNMREDFLHPSNRRWHSALREWGRRVRGLHFFEYWGDGAQYPKPVSDVIKRDLRIDLDEGTRGIYTEWSIDGDAGFVSAIEFWTTCRLLWNADADVDALKATYRKRAFRGAADEMKKFYDVVREAWFSQPGVSYWGDNPIVAMRHLMKDPKRTARCFQSLTNAVAAADHPVSKRLVTGIKTVMEKYAAEVRKTDAKNSGVVIPYCAESQGLSGSEGTGWGGALPIEAGEFAFPYPATNGCAKATPDVRVTHDGSNLWVRLRAPVPSERWDVFVQTAPRAQEGYRTFTALADGTTRGAEGWERKTVSDWKAYVTRQPDRWEAIFRISYDCKAMNPDGTLRLMFAHVGDGGEIVTWKGGRPHRPGMFVKVRLQEKPAK